VAGSGVAFLKHQNRQRLKRTSYLLFSAAFNLSRNGEDEWSECVCSIVTKATGRVGKKSPKMWPNPFLSKLIAFIVEKVAQKFVLLL
jgi:hypothetical protein